jgi:hypothetical protein
MYSMYISLQVVNTLTPWTFFSIFDLDPSPSSNTHSEYETDHADQPERRREPRYVHSFTFSSLSR